jgi:hypothetical protein
VNVFVFPACNEPGLEIIYSLSKSNKIVLFGGSSYQTELDPARHLLKHYVCCPGHSDPDFKATFLELLGSYHIEVVIPAWDPLVAEFAQWRASDIVFITPDAETANLLLSKRATYERLRGIVPVPQLYAPDNGVFPMFAKSDRGSGSRGTIEVRTARELAVAVERDLLLCEYLPGDEYTVDCLGDLTGRLLVANVRARSRIGRGIALSTQGVDEPRIRTYIERIAEALRIAGPWFAQFKKNAAGDPVLLEVNARVGGSMGLTRLSGVNIPLMAVFLFTGHPVRVPKARPGVLINRCLRTFTEGDTFDVVIWDFDDTILRPDGKPDPEAVACLYDLHNRGIRQWLLSKNPDIAGLLERYQIPRFFQEVRCTDDKALEVRRLVDQCGIEPSRCLMVNDSYTERFILEEQYPSLGVVTPDALDFLGRERVG